MFTVSPLAKKAALIALASFPLLCGGRLAGPALAGQTVIVDGDVSGSVSGNNNPPYYGSSWPPPNLSDPNNNTVIVNSGTVSGDVDGGDAWGAAGSEPATASGNTVTINGGEMTGGVYGGYAGYADSGSGPATASGNSVTINGGVVTGGVHGGSAGYAGYAGSGSGPATASGNSVTINGGEVTGYVYGGSAKSKGSGMSGDAVNNTVVISGGQIGGNIYGGFSAVGSNGETGSATGNGVTLRGAPVLADSLFGGFVAFDSSSTPAPGTDAFSGNSLQVAPSLASGIGVGGGVQNFEFYNFTFPKDASPNAVGLAVAGTAYLNDRVSRAGVIQSVNIQSGGSPLPVGHRFQLITGTLDTTYFNQTTASGQKGATLLYDYNLAVTGAATSVTGQALTATVTGVQANPRAKALSEGRLAGLALVNQGGDLAAGPGLAGAVAALLERREGYGLALFGVGSGGRSRYDTGSQVDISGYSLLTGASFGPDLETGRLALGAFFEYGRGDYDSRNSFVNAASVQGDGEAEYLGGGLLGRLDFAETGPGHFYAEATGRLGRVKSDFAGSDLRDSLGLRAAYDTESRYYGLHLGAGYIWDINDQASLDLYGKYFWARQEGDSVTLATGDPVEFQAADSQRVRLGSRFTYAVNDCVSPYLGAAWEHEFDGRARASTYGYAIAEPSLRGDTGLGELGLTLKPVADSGFSLDLGVRGYTGRREGVAGSLQLRLEF